MFTLYLTIILLISFVVGVAVTSYTLLSAVICFTFAIPLTKELNEAGALAENNPIVKRYTSSALVLIAIFCGVTFLVYWIGSPVIQIGYGLGFVLVVLEIIFNTKQIGVNQKNVSDYINLSSNRKYFTGVTKGPVEDVLTFVHIKVFFDHLNIITSNMAGMEKLSSRRDIGVRATEIFKDAIRIEPETQEGKLAREEAQKYASQVTQLVRMPSLTPITEEEKEMFRNHPMFGFSEDKKRKYESEEN
jgi:hypothetical protein